MVKKIGFIFPGQGSQYPGMAKDFYDSYDCAREVFDCAGAASGLAMDRLCFEENDRLNETAYTQIAMAAAETAILAVLRKEGVECSVSAGLSLGEYTAVAATGAMRQEDMFRVVRQRGILMQEAYPQGGGMTAVLGAETALVEKVCEETAGIVTVANYNCPGQLVISGEKDAVDRAALRLKELGVKRCVPLKVSGPFHSPLLKGAGEALGEVLKDVEIFSVRIPYLSNVTGEPVADKSEIRELLVRQVYSPVRFEQCIRKMIEDGTELFVEIGPGHSLSGFMKRISRETAVCNLEKLADLEQVIRLCEE